MQDSPKLFDASLSGLDWSEWVDRLDSLIGDAGYVERLGAAHTAAFYEDKPVLLVTFESFQQVNQLSGNGQPVGWSMAKALGWSHLALVSDGDTWFRDPRVYGFFDRLIDDGFFEDFDQVVFYGAGAGGYAAAAYSVAAPAAQVVAVRPQATLDPRVAEWDDRFLHMRRTAFDDRYGYAPDMLDAAARAFILYDPEVELDAMHAALFTRDNVTKFRMRHFGPRMEQGLWRTNMLQRILAQASAGKLTRLSLARLFRARRDDVPYLKQVLARLERDERTYFVALLAQYVMRQRPGPRFRRAMRAAFEAGAEQGLKMPEREFD